MSFCDFLEYWLSVVSNNLAMTTLYGYRNIIYRHIIPSIGSLSLSELKPYNLHTYYNNKLSEGLSSNTVRKHHDLIKTALSLAYYEGYIDYNIADRCVAPRKRNSKIGYYDAKTLVRLLDCAGNSNISVVIYLCAFLGLRRGEVAALTWDDVDFDNNTVTICRSMVSGGNNIVVKEPKNKTSNRCLFLPATLKDVLMQEYNTFLKLRSFDYNYNPDSYVVVNRAGSPHHPNYLSYEFSKFIRANNLPYLTLHGLRHTFATVANQAGVTLFDISKALGHSTPAVTGRIYTHLTAETIKKAVDAVSDLIDTTSTGK